MLDFFGPSICPQEWASAFLLSNNTGNPEKMRPWPWDLETLRPWPWDLETMRVRKGFHCLWLNYQNQQCAHQNLSGFFENNQRHLHRGCQLHWTRKLQKSCVICSQMFPLWPNICFLGFDSACSVPNSFVSKHNFVDFCFYNQSVFSQLAMFWVLFGYVSVIWRCK